MGFEPQKFFVGLIDFFSVLLPGAILVYLTKDWAGPLVLGEAYPRTPDAPGVAVFLLASYLAGHFLFLAGTWLDEGYDTARRHTLDRRIWELAWRGTLRPWWQRAALWLLFRREQNVAVRKASEIKAASLAPLQAASSVNTFQWAKLHLSAEDPQALATVQRFEADSKFFRSTVAALVVLFLVKVAQGDLVYGAALAVLVPPALLRYADQRFKATTQAYWAVIALEGRRGTLTLPKPPTPDGEPTHAGGVVFRGTGAGVRVLLVEAARTPGEWVLPKGHLEPGEPPRVAAVREVHEETGVWARHRQDDNLQPITLGTTVYDVGREQVRCLFFLMEYAGRGRASEPWRRAQWFTPSEAVARLRYEDARGMVLAGAARSQGA